ncbi:MAG: hypothetical protein A3J66_03865 [Candidatus Magasanikbacteria bacterium RIFCSPHIGHO2_02_FULL_47_14]|uniref:Uncharacterized protein n=1 Tax=Candidatus Magasanikbacteria bacterium RIFCSPHIGHO2_02_FULL_47_14 TaxID=1798680 RepID=A0A1F6M117_9BACT|nr:MAG: hypothetical protein A3J66_03865 [Candidatus Magasanikbacteria bacterium RIFCSPHIGHO2_02_FULL_47_14]
METHSNEELRSTVNRLTIAFSKFITLVTWILCVLTFMTGLMFFTLVGIIWPQLPKVFLWIGAAIAAATIVFFVNRSLAILFPLSPQELSKKESNK